MTISKQCENCKCDIHFSESDLMSKYKEDIGIKNEKGLTTIMISANIRYIMCPICKEKIIVTMDGEFKVRPLNI